MNEQQPDTQLQAPAAEAQRDPVVFAPRITPELREQIEGVRKLTGQTINDLGTEALTDWVAKKLGDCPQAHGVQPHRQEVRGRQREPM